MRAILSWAYVGKSAYHYHDWHTLDVLVTIQLRNGARPNRKDVL